MSDFSFKNITMRFGDNLVLDSVAATLPDGGIVGLLGLNGAGKTTLFRCLTGCLPTDGETSKKKPTDVSYMPVDSLLYKEMSLLDGLSFYADFMPNFDLATAEAKFLELGFDLKKRIVKFSSGQKRIINFLFAINCDAKLYLFDEPLSNLDIIYRDLVVSTLLNEIKQGKVFVVSTHELADIDTALSHITILNNHKLTPVYDVEDIRADGKELGDFYKDSLQCVLH